MAKMKEYTASAVVMLHSGKVKLNKDQARRRRRCLEGKKDQKSGVFRIVKPIQFKVGEAFGYDGEIPKSMIGQLETDDVSSDEDKAGGTEGASGTEDQDEGEEVGNNSDGSSEDDDADNSGQGSTE